MNLPRSCAALLAASLIGAAPLPTVYVAPAGTRAAGAPHAAHPYDLILPNGRIAAPVGKSVAVGMNALGVALSPGGRYAIITNDGARGADARDSLLPQVRGGYSLTVVKTATMAITDVYASRSSKFFLGVVALRDPRNPRRTLVIASGGARNDVRFFRLDRRGRLHGDGSPVPVAGFPGSIVLSTDHRTAYVVDNLGDEVSAIDIASHKVTSRAAVGYFPYAAVLAGDRLLVTDPGLMRYTKLLRPAALPRFVNVPFAPARSSALTTLALGKTGALLAGAQIATPMDEPPDAVENVGGAHPGAIAISKNKRYAYVCMTNVDRIAIVDLRGTPRVIGGLDLRLFENAPYGTQPDAITTSPDGKRVYVALAGMNAIAVLDAHNPAKLHRLGLIPSGWYPSAIAVSSTGRYLYVTNAKGWSTLQRIDLHRLPLQKTTLSALRYNRVALRPLPNPIMPPLRSGLRSSAIRHVVFILDEAGDGTYATMLGGPADVAPNLHELADEFALATNFYAEGEGPGEAHQFAAAGIATTYTEDPLSNRDDPEAYPRAGYIFNALARAGRSYRDYGELVDLAGYEPGESGAGGLGGRYTLDVPALAALGGHIDTRYPGRNPRISDAVRAKEFVRDYTSLEESNAVPSFSYVWLPAGAADADGALGTIVQFLSSRPSWRSTAIFIASDGKQPFAGNPAQEHAYAIVVSPYAKRRYMGTAHLSTASIIKSEEELLGLRPLSLGDLLATDFSGFFMPTADMTPYTAVE